MLDIKSLLIYFLNLAILIVAIRYLAYKPVVRFMDARRQRFSGERAQIDQAREEAHKDKEVYEGLVKSARAEAEQLQHKRLSEVEDQAKAIVKAAHEQADHILAEARARVAQEMEIAHADMKNEAIELGMLIAERVLQREVKESDTRAYIEDFLSKVE